MSFLPHEPLASNQHRWILFGIAAIGFGLLIVSIVTSPWLLVVGAVALLAIFLTWKEPMWAVLFLLAWWPLEPFILKFIHDDVYVFARYASEILIYVLVIVVIVGLITKRFERRFSAIDVPFVLFLLMIGASIILNAIPVVDAALGLRQIVRFMLLFFVVLYRYPRRYWIKYAMVVLCATLFLQSLLGITQALSGGGLDAFLLPSERRTFGDIQLTEGTVQFWDPGQRVFGTFGRYDRMGAFLAFVLLLVVAFVYESDTQPEWKWLGWLTALGLPALLLTYSRSAWFGLILGALVIGWVRKDKRVLYGAVIAGVVLASILGFSGIQKTLSDVPRQTVVERFFEAFSYERFRGEYYGIGRVFWILHTPQTVVSHSAIPFLFGWGPAQYGGGAVAALGNTRVYDAVGLPFGVYGTEGYIDNNWMSLWGETGTLGIILYAWLYIALMVVGVRVARHGRSALTRAVGAGYVGVSVAVGVNAFLATFLEIRTLAPYLWVWAAFMITLGGREKILITRVRRSGD